MPEAMEGKVRDLNVEKLETLGIALLDFTSPADAEQYLRDHA